MSPQELAQAVNAITFEHTFKSTFRENFHYHRGYGIYLFLSGDMTYFVEKNSYRLGRGDMLLVRDDEFHRYDNTSGGQFEKMAVRFDPMLGEIFSHIHGDLLQCFDSRTPGERNRVRLQPAAMEELLLLLGRFEKLSGCVQSEAAILKLTTLLELLLYVNKLFLAAADNGGSPCISTRLLPILDHIDTHLGEDLSLQALSQRFYLNSSYLSSLFKNSTGVTIREYIRFKRISLAKRLLAEGCSVTEACLQAGFHDYSNFIRAFKAGTGVSPGSYKRKNRHSIG